MTILASIPRRKFFAASFLQPISPVLIVPIEQLGEIISHMSRRNFNRAAYSSRLLPETVLGWSVDRSSRSVNLSDANPPVLVTLFFPAIREAILRAAESVVYPETVGPPQDEYEARLATLDADIRARTTEIDGLLAKVEISGIRL